MPKPHMPKPHMPKPHIDKLVVMGDSLSDTGSMNTNKVMRHLSKVAQSPNGRFTNGKVWSDYLLEKWSFKNQENTEKLQTDSSHHKKK